MPELYAAARLGHGDPASLVIGGGREPSSILLGQDDLLEETSADGAVDDLDDLSSPRRRIWTKIDRADDGGIAQGLLRIGRSSRYRVRRGDFLSIRMLRGDRQVTCTARAHTPQACWPRRSTSRSIR
ncbi:MAG: hypothetical protein U0575_04445 [Phycisphaerales bacterium]